MILATDETPALPQGIDALLPTWAQQLSLVTLLVIIITAWLRGWVITKAQNERDIAAERRIADIWQQNFEKATLLNEEMTKAFAPVLDSNAAILKAVEAVQREQEGLRERRGRSQ